MLSFIDANCRIGNGPVRREGAANGIEDLGALMDRFRITEAVVYHSVSQYSDPKRGNALLLEETKEDSRFLPQWAVLPRLWELFPSPDAILAQMKQNRVASVRLFPAQYGHSLRPYAAGALMGALADCRVPAFINFDQFPSWDAVYDLCAAYPDNRFVLCSFGYRCLRWLVPILDACNNLWLSADQFLMHDGFTEFCRYQGADKLLFGSGFPDGSVAAAVSQLALSPLPEEEKQKIASENLKKLLSEVRL